MFMTTIVSVIINDKINKEKLNLNLKYTNNNSNMSEEFEIYFMMIKNVTQLKVPNFQQDLIFTQIKKQLLNQIIKQ